MADAFLTSDLQLDVRAALQQVDRLNEALNRATTGIIVTADVRQVTASIDAAVEAADALLLIAADTSQVPGEITAAVDAADSAVVVTGDATEVTGSIDGAVDAADTGVVVTGDATGVTGSIDSAVENANTSVEVTGQAAQVTGAIDAAVQNANTTVSVEGQVSPGLRQGVDSLGDSLDAAATSGIGLKGIIAGLSVAGAVAGLRALADAGSDLAESTSKAATVFGDEFEDIEAFANGAADSVGLSKQAALEATGTFGNLFQALGTSREEAAKLSPEVVQLAGDLASFNNLGVDEALEKLRSGLVGEIEPLRSLGVSFLAADVTAKALELGLGGVTGELTEGEKVQARYALIVEQTSLAQGDFARTSEGLANQQRSLKAELDNAAAAAGTLLLPAFLAIVDAGRDAIPSLSQLGEDVLPAVSDALVNLAPLIGTAVDLLVLLSPIITVLATALASIPSEAIAVGAGVLVAAKAFKLLTTLGGGLAVGIPKIAAAIGALNPLVAAAAVGGGLLFKEWQEGKDRAADVAAVIDAMSDSFAGVGTDVASARAAIKGFLTDLAESGDKIQSTFAFFDEKLTASEVFKDLGLSASLAADLIAGGTDAVDAFGAELNRLGTPGGAALVLLRELAGQAGEGAKANLIAREATDGLTDAQGRRLDRLIAIEAPTELYVALLDEVSASEAAAAAETERLTALYTPLIASLTGGGEALANLAKESPEASAAIAALGEGGAVTDAEFLALAGTLDAATLSEEGMAQAAAGLGISVESLQVFIENTTGALSAFVDTAVAGLPTISQAFRDANDDSKVSAREFIDGLAEDTVLLNNFIADLNTIISEGFTNVAATLAEQGVEAAGVAASELAGAARAGNNALLAETHLGLTNRDNAIAGSTAFLRDVLGPEYVAETGAVGLYATATFGANFNPEEQVRIRMGLAAAGLSEEGIAVAAIAASVGSIEAREYGKALNLDERTVAEAVRAGEAIKANAPTAAGFEAGDSVGGQLGDGMAYGLGRKQGAVAEAARALVRNALTAAEIEARVESPSKVTTRLGELIGEGFVIGLRHSVAAVAAEAAAVADAALVELPPLTLGVDFDREAAARAVAEAERIVSSFYIPALDVQPVVQVVDPGVGLDGAAGGVGVSVTIAAGAITVQAPAGMTREQGVEVGEGIADGLERRLVERRLSVLSRAT